MQTKKQRRKEKKQRQQARLHRRKVEVERILSTEDLAPLIAKGKPIGITTDDGVITIVLIAELKRIHAQKEEKNGKEESSP